MRSPVCSRYTVRTQSAELTPMVPLQQHTYTQNTHIWIFGTHTGCTFWSLGLHLQKKNDPLSGSSLVLRRPLCKGSDTRTPLSRASWLTDAQKFPWCPRTFPGCSRLRHTLIHSLPEHNISSQFIHNNTLHYPIPHYIASHWTITMNCIALQHTRYTTLHHTTPHYTTLHRTTLHCIALHDGIL